MKTKFVTLKLYGYSPKLKSLRNAKINNYNYILISVLCVENCTGIVRNRCAAAAVCIQKYLLGERCTGIVRKRRKNTSKNTKIPPFLPIKTQKSDIMSYFFDCFYQLKNVFFPKKVGGYSPKSPLRSEFTFSASHETACPFSFNFRRIKAPISISSCIEFSFQSINEKRGLLMSSLRSSTT